ncbi:lipopolysaccharide assembly protein LapA domain-containing protein [Enterovirga aerilata]|uniref:LapA family protein n=1 Tax=Enterovirga aerilata TaxID=2730920 RepID=A0A849IB56_9HYPH|nr:LapA family protein [Enterovirga sp. DB1703]NNM71173.1 LapA family protein [Enterovirga sp. DB1703]
MLGFLKALILLPIAILVVLLAVANRGPVVLSFDPFSKGAPELSVTLPLFALILGSVALGVVLGGVGSWLAAGRQRRERRMSAREINRLKAEADRLRDSIVQNRPALPGSGATY